MIVTQLKIANLRAMEATELHFQPGFNLIVGVNGVGKTSVLDALRICMSRILPKITVSRAKAIPFSVDDIRTGYPFLDVTIHLDIKGIEFRFTRLQWKENVATEDNNNLELLRRQIFDTERLRDRARNLLRELEQSQDLPDSDTYTPDLPDLKKAASELSIVPLSAFYSTNRSVISEGKALKGKAAGGPMAAYADALLPRSWNIGHFADWMRVQMALSKESESAFQHIRALKSAAKLFLPECKNLRPVDKPKPSLLIEKEGCTLDVRQLSDGERGILSMALDLARRLSQANPNLEDPLSDGSAIVLIDEIDLHLHPKWQRQIVHNLAAAFPRCQFIATTHSPQVIGEIEHERIQIIADGLVYSPTHSYGVDSSRVLEEIMDSDPRSKEVKEMLNQISQAIGKNNILYARDLLAHLVKRLGELDPEVTRIRTLLDFVEGNE